MSDFIDTLIGSTIFLLALSLFLILGVAAWDGVQSIRAFDATVACEAERMKPLRKPFSTEVSCVLVTERRDTTTVEIVR